MPRRRHLSQGTGTAQRLNKILSSAGLTSRRNADRLIRSGSVTVNGKQVTRLGASAVWGVDKIRVDGQEIPSPSERLYLILNKPFGYICALKDPGGRPLITELLTDLHQRVYPVGRLDFDTLGLLPLTNDGEWAHRLTHPRFHVPRTYKITIAGRMSDPAMAQLKKGVLLEDGPTGPSKIGLIMRSENQSIIRMTITQGRNRQVRRMIEATGFRVVHLIRTAFGSVRLGDLKVGTFRHLSEKEVMATKKLVGMI
ncbi:MAG: rRNA pseudouridine synthase [Deltaproteobacteria bacterium]|nr:rRNA pseudouridine synthase [Deltaproteobacteria bacterium]